MTKQPATTPDTSCLFAAFIGAPNAGKSTLLNQCVGAKIAIVTPKEQTTRFRIRGIRVLNDTQLIFTDTPGIFNAKQKLDQAMVKAAWSGATESDRTLLLIDAIKGLDERSRAVLERAKADQIPLHAIILNKVDRVAKDQLLALTAQVQELSGIDQIFMVSALTGDGVEDLLNWLCQEAPEGPWLYPADQLSDLNERLIAAEYTREQLFYTLRQELPYVLHVETEHWQERKDGSVKIDQTIYVERDGHKGIILGKKGQQLKAIGEKSRKNLTHALGRPVHLFLHIKVRDQWKNNPEFYRTMGLEF